MRVGGHLFYHKDFRLFINFKSTAITFASDESVFG